MPSVPPDAMCLFSVSWHSIVRNIHVVHCLHELNLHLRNRRDTRRAVERAS